MCGRLRVLDRDPGGHLARVEPFGLCQLTADRLPWLTTIGIGSAASRSVLHTRVSSRKSASQVDRGTRIPASVMNSKDDLTQQMSD